MTQLSNVPMQPKPDAVERPLILVEKLEQEIESLENSFEQFAISCSNFSTKVNGRSPALGFGCIGTFDISWLIAAFSLFFQSF